MSNAALARTFYVVRTIGKAPVRYVGEGGLVVWTVGEAKKFPSRALAMVARREGWVVLRIREG